MTLPTPRSSWTVEDGWALPYGRKDPGAAPRIEAAPSMRGKPPLPARMSTAERRQRRR